MMNKNLFPVAKEGWNYIGYCIGASIIFFILGLDFLTFLFFALAMFLVFIFRNPERELANFENLSVLSPIDGKVLAIDEIKDSDYAYKLTINNSFLDVSILRVPMTSDVSLVKKENGTRLGFDEELSEKINENTILVFQDDKKNKLKLVHRLKQSFCPIEIGLIESKKFNQSSRYGVMVNGITTIYLPQNFRLNVSVLDEVKASETLIGYFS